MCEETKNPATQVPKAMCGALFLSWLCGFIFLIPLMFVMPAIEEVISDPYGQPLPFILRSAIGSEGGAFALTVPIIVLGIICGIAVTTASSRCVWAFSRDGAIPGSGLWKQVNAKLNVPLNAMMLSMAIQILLGLIYFGSYAAFSAFSGSAVIFLTIAYTMPIVASLLGGRKHLSACSWDFGVIGVICNVISIGVSASRISGGMWTLLTTIFRSVDHVCPSPFQLPFFQPYHPRNDELRICCLHWRYCGLSAMVFRLGPQELQGSTYAR